MKKFFAFALAALMTASMSAASLYSADFTQSQGDWTIEIKSNPDNLEAIWTYDSQYTCMKATAYADGSNHESEAWFISPAIDLSAATNATFKISQARRYGQADQISIKATKDGETWTDLELSEWPTGSSFDFVDGTADFSEFAGEAAVKIACVFTSTAQGGPTWEIKTVEITDEEAPVVEEPDVVITGAEFAGQGTSNTGSQVSATVEGVTFTCDKGYSDDANATLRCYKNGVITITSETEQIGKLVFKFYSTYTGDLDNEVVVNAKEWSYTLTSQARIEKVSVFFGEFEPVVVELDTVTVAEAVEIAKALTPEKGKSATTDKKYVVKGFVVGASSTKQNTWYLADQAGAYGEFQAYQCASVDADVVEGDFVYVTGKIMHYYGESNGEEYHNYEISGGALVHGEAPQGIEDIVLTEKVQKVVVDGAVYVVREGKLFNILGTQVR
ncbi:MAG: choice-of-anchor J domain-containing protein [Paludibacteraceae bacterium]|nr:choice-of-anchor J domain-containing protein [Paludibacteraceae bacterium]